MKDKQPVTPEELERRKQWFEQYTEQLAGHSVVQQAQENAWYACPCCGYKTLAERGGYSICPVCFWEDDGQDEEDANVVRGGPNGSLSLAQARLNYQTYGACELRFAANVRPPHDNEK